MSQSLNEQQSHRSLGICCGTASTPMWRSNCYWPGIACGVSLHSMTPKLLKSSQASPGYTTPKAQSGTSKSTQPADRVPRQPPMNDWLQFSNVANGSDYHFWRSQL